MTDKDYSLTLVSYMLSGVLGGMWILCCLVGPSTPVCTELAYDSTLGYHDIQTCNVWLWYGLAPLGLLPLAWARYCLRLLFPSLHKRGRHNG